MMPELPSTNLRRSRPARSHVAIAPTQKVLSVNDTANKVRIAALAQLKDAQLMIQQGRDELLAATKKIKIAQDLIDASAEMLRAEPTPRRRARQGSPSA